MSDKSDPLSQPDFKARAGISGVGRGFKDTVATDAPPAFYVNQDKVETMGLFDSGGSCPVTFGDPPVQSGGGGSSPVLCEITGNNGIGYSCNVFRLIGGEKSSSSSAGTLIIPGLALGAQIPTGTQVLAYPAQLSVTAMEE